MYYQVPLDEELNYVNRAVEYYLGWGEKLRSTTQGSEWIAHYYAGLLDASKVSALRFRALFFAMRLQPVLSFISQFTREHQRLPRILDLGCGFGLESILICMNGAKVAGVDAVKEKIEGALKLKTAYEEAYQMQLDLSYEQVRLFEFHPDEPYDAVYSSATMHHIEPAGQAIQAVANAIKPGGYFFLSDENGFSPVQQLAVQKRIGWTRPRKYWVTNAETGERFLYGNENIRAPFQWAKHMRKAGLEPQSIKYCRFLPAVDWPVERLVKTERLLRGIPGLTQLGAIGFLLTARKTT